MPSQKRQYVGQIQRPGQNPENIQLVVDKRPVLTSAERAAGLQWVNGDYEPGDVRRYGAVGDGVTDDSTAVQSAFTAGHPVKGNSGDTYYCGTTTITVPAGTRTSLYGVTFKTAVDGNIFLSVTGNDVEIIGLEIQGQGNAGLSDSDERMISCVGSSAAAYKSDLTIRDCYIHGSEFYGIYCEFVEDLRVENCHFQSIRYAAVGCSSVNRAHVNHNEIHDIGPGSAGNSYGVFFSRSSGTLATYPRSVDCEAIGNIVYDNSEWEALDTHAGERIVFADNIIHDCLLGINVSRDSDDFPPIGVIVKGNVIDSGDLSSDPYRAIGSGGSAGGDKAENIVVVGNIIKGYGLDSNSEGAIMFQYTDGLIISDNIIEDSRPGAICLLNDNDYFLISGNSIRGVRNGVANAAGINIRNATQTGHIADNYIDATAEIGIFIADSNTGVSFGRNRIITSGDEYAAALYGGPGLEITGSTTTNVGEIADGDQDQFTITVTGAELGDYVTGITCSISTAALSLTATVTATNTVTAVLQNNTGSAVDLGSATYTALVRKV